jgi:general secretion pathway protein D
MSKGSDMMRAPSQRLNSSTKSFGAGVAFVSLLLLAPLASAQIRPVNPGVLDRGRLGALTGGAPSATPGPAGSGSARPTPPAASASAPTTPAPPGLGAAPAAAASGKRPSDTAALQQFKDEIEFEPRPPGYKVQFSLEDADLPELIKVMGQLTGKRFIFGGKVRNIKATIYSPQKVTVAEAYQAFLSILETNGLTVIPHGKFLKIIETPGVVSQVTPIYGVGAGGAAEDRYVTRLHRLTYVTADEVSNVLGHFKSRDGDITIYSPGNLLIITDTGSNIKRMMSLVEELDVAGIGDQVWVEPIHYASATEIANKLQEIFDVSKGAPAAGPGGAKPAGSQAVETRITKIVPEDRTNSVVVIGTEKAYLRVLELIKRLDVPMTGEGEIHVLPLQHAEAEELAKTLNDITGNKSGGAPAGAPGGGKAPGTTPTTVFEGAIRITADKATNSLIITSSLRDYASLRNVIDRLDQARRQVFLEAVIMEVSTDHSDKLGFRFHGGAPLNGVPDSAGATLLGGLDPLTSAGFPLADPSLLQGLALGLRSQDNITLNGIGLSIPAFGVSMQALSTNNDTNVISTPHILALDNEEATINIGENVPLQSSTGLGGLGALAGASGTTGTSGLGALGALGGLGGLGSFGSISRSDVGTKLKMTPHINDSNEVRLDVEEDITELGPGQGATTIPRITKRYAKTKIVIQDQQTIVIGGLVRDVAKNDVSKIPVLGDIPLIGALFRQTTKTSQKRNLLLIITPYVIRDPTDLREIFERKMQERQEFLDRFFVFAENKDFNQPIDYTRTRGLVEEIRQAYMKVEEKAALDEQLKPKDIKRHEASKPVSELPATLSAGGGGAGAPAIPGPANAPTPPPPNVVKPVAPPAARSVIIEN